MDLTSIGAAYTGLKFAKDTFQVVLGYKIESDTRAKIADAMEKLGGAQDTLFELREELSRLQTDNERVHKDLKARDDWDVRKVQYPLQRTVGGAIVHASSFEPKHFACPACFERREVQILQSRGGSMGFFDCSGCKASYRVGPRESIPLEGPGSSRFPRDF